MMKWLLLAFFLMLLLHAPAQQTDTFAVKKEKPLKNDIVSDTFVQQIFLSDKTVRNNHIVYRTGVKLISPQMLIFFHATQSIIDSVGVREEKNASVGEYRKVPYAIINDSLLFIIKYQVPNMRNPNALVEITKSYSGLKGNKTMLMEVNTTANPPAGARPGTEQEIFTLYKEELLITRRKAK